MLGYMYIKVRVLAGVKKEVIKQISDNHFRISVKEPAQRNLANTRVREILAEQFGISAKEVRIISGHHSPSKIFALGRD